MDTAPVPTDRSRSLCHHQYHRERRRGPPCHRLQRSHRESGSRTASTFLRGVRTAAPFLARRRTGWDPSSSIDRPTPRWCRPGTRRVTAPCGGSRIGVVAVGPHNCHCAPSRTSARSPTTASSGSIAAACDCSPPATTLSTAPSASRKITVGIQSMHSTSGPSVVARHRAPPTTYPLGPGSSDGSMIGGSETGTPSRSRCRAPSHRRPCRPPGPFDRHDHGMGGVANGGEGPDPAAEPGGQRKDVERHRRRRPGSDGRVPGSLRVDARGCATAHACDGKCDTPRNNDRSSVPWHHLARPWVGAGSKPTSSGVTVPASCRGWSGWRDLNPRPLRPERSALPS